MIKFKDLISEEAFNRPVEFPSVEASFNGRILSLRFDSKDKLLYAGYTGKFNPWFSSLCALIINKSLAEISRINAKSWEHFYKDDQLFWDLKQEEDSFIHEPLELLKTTLDVFQGRDYLYHETSPLICRCFGVRETDVLDHLHHEKTPTFETLGEATKAGMGCRTCVPQLKRWLVDNDEKKTGRHYKLRPIADWLVQIDYHLAKFPHGEDWKMEVRGMKDARVTISFDKKVTQTQEEAMARELQLFLGRAVDLDLAFFLRSSRHFLNASGK